MRRTCWLLLVLLAAFCNMATPMNMTVISTKGIVLSIQETYCSSKEICNSENDFLHDTSSVFSPWSPWSKCKNSPLGAFTQTREKLCKYWEICQKTILKEEKPCHKRKKKKKRKKNKLEINKKEADDEHLFHVVTMPSVMSIKHLGASGLIGPSSKRGTEKRERIYSKWSRWTMCTRTCLTHRYRWCKKVEACGNDVIRQTAYCYTEGSHCEILVQEKFSQESVPVETTTESKPEIQHVSTSNSIELPITETVPPISFFETSPSDEAYSCGIAQNRNFTSPLQTNMLRIIGGRPTANGKWPWIVAVLNRYKEAFCGGTLVNPRWVLTAAHCVRKRLYVTIGEYDLNRKEDNEIRLRVRKAVIHPRYDVDTVDNDLALLYLPATAFKHTVACLPKPRDHLPFKQMCTIVGWGKQSASDHYGTEVLHEAQIPIVPRAVCKEVYTDYQITGNMFCAGYRRGRMDSCSGDSGGPLLCQDSYGRWIIFGITSFGEGCGKRGKYGIYTRLPNYVRWIQRVINSN